MASKNLPDLRGTKVIVVVWAMPGCGACDDYLPRFLERVEALKARQVPFHVWVPGEPIAKGSIPVLLCDAASTDEALQDLADKMKVTATPTTCVMTHYNTAKVEGSVPVDQIDALLLDAHEANS